MASTDGGDRPRDTVDHAYAGRRLKTPCLLGIQSPIHPDFEHA